MPQTDHVGNWSDPVAVMANHIKMREVGEVFCHAFTQKMNWSDQRLHF